MLTGSQRNGLGDTIREETCSCGLTRWQHADLAASYILSIKATNKLVHEKIYFSAAVSYLHLSLFHCCIYLCSVNLRRAGKKGWLVGPLSFPWPTQKSTQKCANLLFKLSFVSLWKLRCRQGPEWQASLGDGDKRVGAKEFSKTRSFSSSPRHLFQVARCTTTPQPRRRVASIVEDLLYDLSWVGGRVPQNRGA